VTSLRALLLLVAFATATDLLPTSAQSASDLVDQGVRAYDELEFEAAAASLRRALRSDPGEDISIAAYGRALIYLGATEYYRGNPDSTEALFRRLVLFDTRQRPDPLVFEPGVTDIFEAVRRDTKSLTVVVPPRSDFRIEEGTLPVTLYASSFLGTLVEVFDGDSNLVRMVYDGPVSDSLVVTWDGLDSLGAPLNDGDFALTVTSRRPGGVSLRSTTFPLTLNTQRQDTLSHPEPLADSLFLPERTSGGQGFETLVGGLIIGGGVMLVPSIIAPNAELSGSRFFVGSAVSLAGIVGYFARKPGQIITVNVDANRELREQWNDRLTRVINENALRRSSVRIVIEAGPAEIVELRQP